MPVPWPQADAAQQGRALQRRPRPRTLTVPHHTLQPALPGRSPRQRHLAASAPPSTHVTPRSRHPALAPSRSDKSEERPAPFPPREAWRRAGPGTVAGGRLRSAGGSARGTPREPAAPRGCPWGAGAVAEPVRACRGEAAPPGWAAEDMNPSCTLPSPSPAWRR